jgi:hypothetical protein
MGKKGNSGASMIRVSRKSLKPKNDIFSQVKSWDELPAKLRVSMEKQARKDLHKN